MPIFLPRPTLERLPAYYRVVASIVKSDQIYVSSSELGRRLQIDGALIRRDLSYVWGKGRPGRGYNAQDLLQRLAEVLGFNDVTNAVLVGAGRLGMALHGYLGFQAHGTRIVAVLDADENKIGQPLPRSNSMVDQEILSVDELAYIVGRHEIDLGIITVPDAQAQKVANALVAAGIRAIWNFAPVNLNLPADIIIRNEDLAASLATLQYYLTTDGR